MEVHMKALPFTTEQLAILKENPYTANVTEQRIHFTIDFKVLCL
jgi:hypothetical protein